MPIDKPLQHEECITFLSESESLSECFKTLSNINGFVNTGNSQTVCSSIFHMKIY